MWVQKNRIEIKKGELFSSVRNTSRVYRALENPRRLYLGVSQSFETNFHNLRCEIVEGRRKYERRLNTTESTCGHQNDDQYLVWQDESDYDSHSRVWF